MDGGYYWKDGTAYVKVLRMDHNGDWILGFAKWVDDEVTNLSSWNVYSIKEVMPMAVGNSGDIRKTYKDIYLEAGNDKDPALILVQREDVMGKLWAAAGDLGQEYGGYTTMGQDYLENAGNIFKVNQSQMIAAQNQAWDPEAPGVNGCPGGLGEQGKRHPDKGRQ